METAARLRFARISPQKCRLFADMIRGKPVGDALQLLQHAPNKSAAILRKLLESAIANAEHNDGADIDELRVSAITVDQAPMFKRWKPRAKGRANRIIKQNSHITIRVADE
ncbi:MAG: 50S ribosomal protein L22 [Gammaproteobacteria bacterium]|nr:50S ribosomal protein L22 [Gammaproteobacteria bacterium]NNF61736.1 50S ribosomal protein L22 [Gammaproteobacteria bacterium]NNM20822.1 50S ribosomal protein L22 [Gammaproteobacteria bacterium]